MQKKLIVTALGAFGVGALVGWAVTSDIRDVKTKHERDIYDHMIREKADHIFALQDHIERQWAQSQNPNTAASSETVSISPDQIELTDIHIWGQEEPFKTVETLYVPDVSVVEEEDNYEVPEGETPEETRTNLQKLIDAYTAGQEEAEEFREKITAADNNAPPFVVSKATYAWDEEGDSFNKTTLFYYPRDRILLDDEEYPVEDVANTVGWRNLSQFGSESDDPDVVFIRNRRLETDFEVIMEDSRLPLHVQYGMEKEEFRANRAAGLIKLRQEDDDH